MPASKYENEDGTFKGCVAAQMARGLKKKNAEELCAYIGRQAGKIKGSANLSEDTGGYSFKENESGTFTILDVPIMAEVPSEEKGNERRVGRKWMEASVLKAKKRFSEDGYKAPLHVDHHGQGSTEPAGFVMPREVRQFSYEGRTVWAVFADLEVQPDVFDRVKAQTLPYRSVEIFDWKKPEINSLALLSDEVPYFRFDVLRLGEEVSEVTQFSQPGPAMASRAFTLGSAVLFSFKGGPMTTDAQAQMDAPDTTVELESREEADVDEYRKGEKEGEKKEEEEMSAEMTDVDPSEALRSILSLLGRMAEKLGVGDEDEKIEEKEDEKEVEVSESVEAPVEQSASFISLHAKINALEADARRRKDVESREGIADKAMTALSAWSPDEQTRGNLITLLAQSKKPEATAKTFVASFQATVPQHPASTLEEFDARMGSSTADRPEVLKFAEEGPEALMVAREASQQFDELSTKGLVTASREDFIRTQMLANAGEEIVRR
jgi:hypothetical protein